MATARIRKLKMLRRPEFVQVLIQRDWIIVPEFEGSSARVRIAEPLLADIDKGTVEFVPNFDGKVMESTVLPAAFPNLLVNGLAVLESWKTFNVVGHVDLHFVIECVYCDG